MIKVCHFLFRRIWTYSQPNHFLAVILAFALENQQFGFPTRSDTNRQEEELYYLCSQSKGAGQLCSYCTAELRLCFRICRLLVFFLLRLICLKMNKRNRSNVSFIYQSFVVIRMTLFSSTKLDFYSNVLDSAQIPKHFHFEYVF